MPLTARASSHSVAQQLPGEGRWPAPPPLPVAVRRLISNLAVGGIEGPLFYRVISARCGVGLFPET